MNVENSKSSWTTKGATLSDKSARKEYGISQEQIIKGINDGKLDYRVNSVFGNPYYKLIRKDVELLVSEIYGESYVKKIKLTARLKKVTPELKELKRQVKILTEEKEELEKELREMK